MWQTHADRPCATHESSRNDSLQNRHCGHIKTWPPLASNRQGVQHAKIQRACIVLPHHRTLPSAHRPRQNRHTAHGHIAVAPPYIHHCAHLLSYNTLLSLPATMTPCVLSHLLGSPKDMSAMPQGWEHGASNMEAPISPAGSPPGLKPNSPHRHCSTIVIRLICLS